MSSLENQHKNTAIESLTAGTSLVGEDNYTSYPWKWLNLLSLFLAITCSSTLATAYTPIATLV